MTRRSFLAQAGLAAAAQQRRPNIVLILADDLGYGHLGCYGQQHIRTPNLDRMAREGMRFTDAYSGCTVCAPSRSALMTGLHTGHTSVRSNEGGVPLLESDVTIAEVLKGAGYRTGVFGKWGLGEANTTGVPNRQGFDEFFGYLHQLHAHFYYTPFLWHNDRKVYLKNRNDWRREYSHDRIAAESFDFLRRHRADPFFLYLPFTIPHAELLAPDDAMAEYEGKFPETPFTSAPRYHYAPNPTPKAAIAAMISRLDRTVGQLFSQLAELGIDDNTLVLFSSDNGPDRLNGNDPDFFRAAGPHRGYKTDLYEGGIRVPLIARWPGRVPAGSVNAYPCASWDLFPTLCDVAGAGTPQGLDGESLAHRITREPGAEARRKALYWEKTDDKGGLLGQAARIGNFKAVRNSVDGPLELYDLATDPGESRDVAGTERAMVRQMDDYLKTAHRPARPQTAYPPTDGRRYF